MSIYNQLHTGLRKRDSTIILTVTVQVNVIVPVSVALIVKVTANVKVI